MKVIDIPGGQGSEAWHRHRRDHFNASDAPAVLGCSPFKTREQLLRELYTGIAPEVDAATQRRFDDGHRFEALGRSLAEQIIGDDLYQITVANGRLSASLDGATMDGKVVFEHKTLSEELRNIIIDDTMGAQLPLHYRVQMEQQLYCACAEKALFMASKWDADGALIAERSCWYYSDSALRARILAGWEQFAADLQAYVPREPVAAVAAAPVATLPAVSVRVDGQLTVHSNFDVFAERLKSFIADVPRKPTTDNEFAVAEAAVKTLQKAEEAIHAALDSAVGQTASLEETVRLGKTLAELARTTRLSLGKIVDARKVEIRAEIVGKTHAALREHIGRLNGRLGHPWLATPPQSIFGEAIKGKRTVDTVRDACDQAMATAKIAANAQADTLDLNRKALMQGGQDFMFLFADFAQQGVTSAEIFAAVAEQRIGNHRTAEGERARKAAEAEAKVTAAPSADPVPLARPYVAPYQQQATAPVALAIISPTTLRLGAMSERLGFTVSRAFIETTLGFAPAETVNGNGLWSDGSWPMICAALAEHVLLAGKKT